MIASFCTIQRTYIVTQISLILPEKSPNVRSWIHVEFTNNSVGLCNIQIEFILNSSPRGHSGGQGFKPQWRTFFPKCISWITFARGKVITKCNIQKWPQKTRNPFLVSKTLFIFCQVARPFARILVCCFALGVLFWPKLGLKTCAGLSLAFRNPLVELYDCTVVQ